MMNLLLVFFMTVAVGFLLIFFIKKTSKKTPGEQPISLPAPLQDLNFDQFFSLCVQLLEKLGLVIKDSYRDGKNAADVYAENPEPLIGGPVIAHLHLYPEDGRVTSMDVMNFASNLVGERRGKGLYITTGHIAPEVWTLPELPPMDLVDGKKLEELLKKYQLWEEQGGENTNNAP
jgi:restriction endonuclease Mrr